MRVALPGLRVGVGHSIGGPQSAACFDEKGWTAEAEQDCSTDLTQLRELNDPGHVVSTKPVSAAHELLLS